MNARPNIILAEAGIYTKRLNESIMIFIITLYHTKYVGI
jgi:hypothetical protein